MSAWLAFHTGSRSRGLNPELTLMINFPSTLQRWDVGNNGMGGDWQTLAKFHGLGQIASVGDCCSDKYLNYSAVGVTSSVVNQHRYELAVATHPEACLTLG